MPMCSSVPCKWAVELVTSLRVFSQCILFCFPSPLNCPRAKALSPTKEKASLDSRLRLAIAKPFFRLPFPHSTNHHLLQTYSCLYPQKHFGYCVKMLAVRSFAAPARRQCLQASARACGPTSIQVCTQLQHLQIIFEHYNC